jgi:sulfatase maturation enzyme AslB (radical SAM superfamily)
MTDSPYHRFFPYKLLTHPDRLDAIVAGAMPYPLDWHIYPSNHCNHSCEFCMFIQNGEQQNFHVKLPREVLLRAVRDAVRTGAVLMHFSGGGEPLLNRHTLEALQLAQALSAERGGRSDRMRIAMSTNGSLLKPEIAREINFLRISLNAGTPEQHWRTNHAGDPRHPGDWHRIMDNIAECVPVIRAQRATGEPHDIGLAFVVEHENYHDIPAFCRVAAELGVDFVHIRPGFYYDNALDAATRAVMQGAFRLCEEAKREAGDRVRIFSISDKFDGYWTPRQYHRCRAVLTGVCLRATGDFAVCQDRTDLTFGGAYRRGASFEDVWHSDEHKAVIATIHDGEGGQLTACPRCVWNSRNALIDAWERDDLRITLI